ncbi:MAG: hypothetical protein AB2L18_08955 [Anaerolineaceae bacterium]
MKYSTAFYGVIFNVIPKIVKIKPTTSKTVELFCFITGCKLFSE